MGAEIKGIAELAAFAAYPGAELPDDGFRIAMEQALSSGGEDGNISPVCFDSSGLAVISRKAGLKMQSDPSFAEELTKKIKQMTASLADKRDSIIIVDRCGEITQYNFREKRDDYPSREELRELEKERLRRKARLDAYFKIVQQQSIKRKLIEQENVRRPKNKRYRCAGTIFDCIAQSILQKPNRSQEFYF